MSYFKYAGLSQWKIEDNIRVQRFLSYIVTKAFGTIPTALKQSCIIPKNTIFYDCVSPKSDSGTAEQMKECEWCCEDLPENYLTIDTEMRGKIYFCDVNCLYEEIKYNIAEEY